jgi:DNA-binding transcriptional LysR family regulator
VPGPIAASLVKAGKLVRVLEPFAPLMPGVFLYYPSRHQMMPKLRAFIDHVKSRSVTADKTRIHSDERRTRRMKVR